MFERWLQMGFLRAPEDGEDGGGGGGGDDGEEGGEGGEGEEKKPFATFENQEAFDERIARANRAALKKLGIEDPEAFKAEQAELKELRAAKKKKDDEDLSATERLEAALAESKTKEAAAERAAASSKKRIETVERCAKLGIKDIDYAAFRLSQLGEDVDQDEWLAKTLEDETERARFGIDGDAAPKPANTTTGGAGGGGAPPAKKPSGAKEGGAKSVADMSPEEFQAHKEAKHGIHG